MRLLFVVGQMRPHALRHPKRVTYRSYPTNTPAEQALIVRIACEKGYRAHCQGRVDKAGHVSPSRWACSFDLTQLSYKPRLGP
jgi:hypothetical protein